MSRTPSDYQLCLRVRDGDEWAFEELLRRHRDILWHRVNGVRWPGGDRQDVMQIARLGVLKAARTFSPQRGATVRGFIGLVVRAEINTEIKTQTRRKCSPLNDGVSLSLPVADEYELGEVLCGPDDDDPCSIVIAAEAFHGQVEVVATCSSLERRAVARRLNGAKIVTRGRYDKQLDNALQRVRRKLAAAA